MTDSIQGWLKKSDIRNASLALLGMVLALIVVDYLLDWKILGLLKSFLYFVFVKTVPLPVWAVLILSVLGISHLIVLLYKNFTSTNYSVSAMYNRDVVYDILWQWDWNAGQINLNTLFPICPICSHDMDELSHGGWVELNQTSLGSGPDVISGKQTNVQCDNCRYSKSFQKEKSDLHKDVSRELIRRIREGEDTKANLRIADAKKLNKPDAQNA
jgi:hypothetical protein